MQEDNKHAENSFHVSFEYSLSENNHADYNNYSTNSNNSLRHCQIINNN